MIPQQGKKRKMNAGEDIIRKRNERLLENIDDASQEEIKANIEERKDDTVAE